MGSSSTLNYMLRSVTFFEQKIVAFQPKNWENWDFLSSINSNNFVKEFEKIAKFSISQIRRQKFWPRSFLAAAKSLPLPSWQIQQTRVVQVVATRWHGDEELAKQAWQRPWVIRAISTTSKEGLGCHCSGKQFRRLNVLGSLWWECWQSINFWAHFELKSAFTSFGSQLIDVSFSAHALVHGEHWCFKSHNP